MVAIVMLLSIPALFACGPAFSSVIADVRLHTSRGFPFPVQRLHDCRPV